YTRRFRATERKRKRDPRTGAVQAIVPGLITRRNFELLVCNITPAGGAGRASGVLGGWASRALGGPGVRRVWRVGVPRVKRAGWPSRGLGGLGGPRARQQFPAPLLGLLHLVEREQVQPGHGGGRCGQRGPEPGEQAFWPVAAGRAEPQEPLDVPGQEPGRLAG